jgi:hypothetical protein
MSYRGKFIGELRGAAEKATGQLAKDLAYLVGLLPLALNEEKAQAETAMRVEFEQVEPLLADATLARMQHIAHEFGALVRISIGPTGWSAAILDPERMDAVVVGQCDNPELAVRIVEDRAKAKRSAVPA